MNTALQGAVTDRNYLFIIFIIFLCFYHTSADVNTFSKITTIANHFQSVSHLLPSLSCLSILKLA